MKDDNLLPETITMRALVHMENGVEAIEAVRLAFEEEERTIYLAAYGVDLKTGRMHRNMQKELMTEMCGKVYNKLNPKSNPLQ